MIQLIVVVMIVMMVNLMLNDLNDDRQIAAVADVEMLLPVVVVVVEANDQNLSILMNISKLGHQIRLVIDHVFIRFGLDSCQNLIINEDILQHHPKCYIMLKQYSFDNLLKL